MKTKIVWNLGNAYSVVLPSNMFAGTLFLEFCGKNKIDISEIYTSTNNVITITIYAKSDNVLALKEYIDNNLPE